MKKGRPMKSMMKVVKKSMKKVAKKSMKEVKKTMKDAKKSMKKIGGMKKKTMKKSCAKKVAATPMKKPMKAKKPSEKGGAMKKSPKKEGAMKKATKKEVEMKKATKKGLSMKKAAKVMKKAVKAVMKSAGVTKSSASASLKSSLPAVAKKSANSPRGTKTRGTTKGPSEPRRNSLPSFFEAGTSIEGTKKKRRSSIGSGSEKKMEGRQKYRCVDPSSSECEEENGAYYDRQEAAHYDDFLANSSGEDSDSYPYPSLSNPQAFPDRDRSPPPPPYGGTPLRTTSSQAHGTSECKTPENPHRRRRRLGVFDVSPPSALLVGRLGYSRHPDEDPFKTPEGRRIPFSGQYSPKMMSNTLGSPGRTPFNMNPLNRLEDTADSFNDHHHVEFATGSSSYSSCSPEEEEGADSIASGSFRSQRGQYLSPPSTSHSPNPSYTSSPRVALPYQSPDGRVRPRGYEPREYRRVGSAELLGRRQEIIPPPPSARRHSLDLRDPRNHTPIRDGRMRSLEEDSSSGSERYDELQKAPIYQVRNRFNMPVEPEEYLLDIFQVLDEELQRDICAGKLSRFDSIQKRVNNNCDYFLNINRLCRIIGHARSHLEAQFIDEILTIIQLKNGLQLHRELSRAEMYQRVREVKELLEIEPAEPFKIVRPSGTRPRGLQYEDLDRSASSIRLMR